MGDLKTGCGAKEGVGDSVERVCFFVFFEAFSMKRQFTLDFIKIPKDYCPLLSTFAKCCAIIAPSRQQIAIAAQQ
jgi:hypothetical protein